MNKLLSALLIGLLSTSALAGPKYTTEETDIGTLMNDPKAHAILEKYLPNTISDPQFTMAQSFTLVFIKTFDQKGELTDETLAKIDEEFATLAAGE